MVPGPDDVPLVFRSQPSGGSQQSIVAPAVPSGQQVHVYHPSRGSFPRRKRPVGSPGQIRIGVVKLVFLM